MIFVMHAQFESWIKNIGFAAAFAIPVDVTVQDNISNVAELRPTFESKILSITDFGWDSSTNKIIHPYLQISMS